MVCEKCGGEGKITNRVDHSDEPWRDIGHGLQIGGGMSIKSELCECRKRYRPRSGEAVWWDSEQVFLAECEESVFGRTHTVSVKVEVPIDKDNYRVHRTGNNVYMGTFVDLDNLCFFPAEARALASALVAAADKCEQLDAS